VLRTKGADSNDRIGFVVGVCAEDRFGSLSSDSSLTWKRKNPLVCSSTTRKTTSRRRLWSLILPRGNNGSPNILPPYLGPRPVDAGSGSWSPCRAKLRMTRYLGSSSARRQRIAKFSLNALDGFGERMERRELFALLQKWRLRNSILSLTERASSVCGGSSANCAPFSSYL
jgi:hypothetical protein